MEKKNTQRNRIKSLSYSYITLQHRISYIYVTVHSVAPDLIESRPMLTSKREAARKIVTSLCSGADLCLSNVIGMSQANTQCVH